MSGFSENMEEWVEVNDIIKSDISIEKFELVPK